LTLLSGIVCAEENDDLSAKASVEIGSLESAPVLDGNINESEWAGATIIDRHFIQYEPEFGEPSPFRTVVRIAQTEQAIYIAFEAFDFDMERLAAAKTQRDSELDDDDSVMVMFDTFADKRTGYLFGTNALATQLDARIADNGRTVDDRWDAAWRSAAVRHEDRWTVEMEIPFAILKFAGNSDGAWGLNFLRSVPRRLEKSLWAEPSEELARVSAFGELTGINPSQAEDAWTFIPYALASYEKGENADLEAGGDIRWRPSSRIGVDLTINPDFALVEADVETINLSRFELRIPEKRPFFLEGNEMYSQRIEQFYSRRIGDLTWGAKSNGKFGQTDFSAIVSSADIERDDGLDTDRADYGVVRVQHGLWRGSNVGLLAANRHYLGDNAGSAGIDSTLFFTDTLGMTAQLLRVHGPDSDNGLAWFVRPSWDSARSHFHISYTNLAAGIKDSFNATGFLEDDDRKEFDTNAKHEFWFETGPVEKVEPRVNYNRFTSQEGVLRSWELDASLEVVFRNGWEITLNHIEEFKLFEKEFRNERTVVELDWDGRDGREVSVHAGTGINYDSDLFLYGASLRWPIGDKWRLEYALTRLELDPDPELESTTIHVFEVLYAFHANLYAKLFVQTNSAIDKENIQALGVWRFKPPFGSLQLAYQRGTSERGQQSDQDDTFFTKFSWVF
jgi:hypothetical protein